MPGASDPALQPQILSWTLRSSSGTSDHALELHILLWGFKSSPGALGQLLGERKLRKSLLTGQASDLTSGLYLQTNNIAYKPKLGFEPLSS